MMRFVRVLCAALMLAGPARAASTPDFTPFTGGGPLASEFGAKLNGKPVTIVQLSAYYHQMDLPKGSVQPIGLELFFFVIKSAKPGNAAHCEQWVAQVQADEAAWTKQSPTFPYLEINHAKDARPVLINGLQAYQDADVECWEARDLGPPLF